MLTAQSEICKCDPCFCDPSKGNECSCNPVEDLPLEPTITSLVMSDKMIVQTATGINSNLNSQESFSSKQTSREECMSKQYAANQNSENFIRKEYENGGANSLSNANQVGESQFVEVQGADSFEILTSNQLPSGNISSTSVSLQVS